VKLPAKPLATNAIAYSAADFAPNSAGSLWFKTPQTIRPTNQNARLPNQEPGFGGRPHKLNTQFYIHIADDWAAS